MTDKIAGALGIDIDMEQPSIQAEPLKFSKDDVNEDYRAARQTAYDLIAKGNHTLDVAIRSLLDNATVGRLEVIANLMKTVMEANLSRLDIQEKYQKLNPGTSQRRLEGEYPDEQPRLIYRNASDLLDSAHQMSVDTSKEED